METTDWTFPALDSVWEYRNGAILAGGDRLDGLCGDDRERCLAGLRQRVEMLVDRLDDGWLLTTAFFMVEDLFKSYFRWDQWTPGMHDYIAATATVVIEELARRGFVLHYVIDNTQGDAHLAAMLTYLPQVFRAAGLAVIGPQLVAVDLLMKAEGQPPAETAAIQRYRDEGHAIADAVVSQWHQERRSSVYLNLDLNDDLPALDLSVALSQSGAPETIVVFRNLPPMEGTQSTVFPPPGVAMPPGMPGAPSTESGKLPAPTAAPTPSLEERSGP